MLPILHLNGYKIANPCFLARIPKDELQKFFEGMGYTPYFVEGHDPAAVHQQLAGVLDTAVAEIKRIWADARENGNLKRPAWPMIVFRTPKGWTCPPEIDGKKCEDYWRAHQVPKRSTGANLFRIVPAQPYPEDYEAQVAQAEKERERGYEPPLQERVADIVRYQTVFLGFPVWGTTAPSIIRSFLSQHDVSGKTLVPFITHGVMDREAVRRSLRSTLPVRA